MLGGFSCADTTGPGSPVFGDTWTSSFCTWVITELSIWQSRSPQNPQILSPSTDGHPSLGFVSKWAQLFAEVTCHPPQFTVLDESRVLSCSWVSLFPRRSSSSSSSSFRRSAWGGGKALGYVFRRLFETPVSSVVSGLYRYYYWLFFAEQPPSLSRSRRCEVFTLAPTTWRIQAREGKQPRKWGKGGRFQAPPYYR